MRRLVLDAGALLAWFDHDGPGRGVRLAYEAGDVTVIGPRRLPADVLDEIARRGTDSDRLSAIAAELARLRLQLQDPPLTEVAHWVSRGLDARRASYAALAAVLDVRLVTSDADLGRVAAPLVTPA